MSNPGQLSHLVEPGAGILLPPRSIQAQFNDILRERDKLRVIYEEKGVDALSGEERVRLAAANIIEAQLASRCRKTADAIITKRAGSTRLADRFLCAVFPPYLAIKPASAGVVRAAKIELIAEFDNVISRWQEGDAREQLEKLFAEEIVNASVLQKPLAVGKPLTLKGRPS